MRKRTSLAVVLLVLLLLAAPVLAITWGQPDGSAHPNVGAIVVTTTIPDLGQIAYCSGTLVHPQVFLTAAHCTEAVLALLDNPDVTGVYVTFDEDAATTTDLLAWDEIISHPNWTGGYNASNTYDVGAIVLAEPVGITPAILPDEGYLDELNDAGMLKHGQDRAKFTIVGYGATLDWPPPETTYEDQRQNSQSEFQALLKYWLRMSQNAALDNGGSCYGDSGGPAFYVDENGQEILVGITSWGDIPCVSTGYNYRVDIPATLEFIAEVVASLD